MKEIIIVDGYNLLNAWEELRELSRSNLSHARDILMDNLENYGAFKGVQIIVVFDGAGSNVDMREERGKIEVVYTKDGKTADSFIEKLVSELTGKFKVTVVTSDYEEQKSIFGSGAVRYSSREFVIELTETKEKERNNYGKHGKQRNYLDGHLDSNLFFLLDEMRKREI